MKRNRHENPDEAALIRAIKRGSENAFTSIFNMYFDSLYQYSTQFLKSGDDAEDIVQEAFIRFWNHRQQITSEKSVKALLFTTTRNLLISRVRQKINSPTFEDYLEYCNALGSEDHSHLEFNEFVAKIEDCISSLPPHQQRVVRMSKFEHKTNKEIAAILDINEQSVKNNLSLGLKYIRSHLPLPSIIIMLIFS